MRKGVPLGTIEEWLCIEETFSEWDESTICFLHGLEGNTTSYKKSDRRADFRNLAAASLQSSFKTQVTTRIYDVHGFSYKRLSEAFSKVKPLFACFLSSHVMH